MVICNPEISVIVPVYKAENYLEECVRSILRQTYRDFELILIEDGSPDRCGEICDRLAQTDARIVVVHKKNEGVSIARNTGIARARGRYLAFVDSDDTINAGFLESALSAVEGSGADMYISGLFMETWKDNEIVSTQRYGNCRTKVYSVKELLEKRDIEYPYSRKNRHRSASCTKRPSQMKTVSGSRRRSHPVRIPASCWMFWNTAAVCILRRTAFTTTAVEMKSPFSADFTQIPMRSQNLSIPKCAA